MNKRSFIPYLLMVFFNSFVDLGHKILIQDTLYQTSGSHEYTILSSILNALILLPYLFMFTPAGYISDHFAKVKVLRVTAVSVIPIACLITLSYYQGWFWVAFAFTLVLGLQSAINSPAKYGYIKEIFGKSEIAKANAYVQTVTIIAILAGTFVFTIFFTKFISSVIVGHGASKAALLQAFAPLGFLLVVLSALESFCTFRLTSTAAANPTSSYQVKHYFTGRYLKQYLKEVSSNNSIFTCIIGLGLIWGINQVLLASYGAYCKVYVPHATALFAQGSIAMAGIGILLGALYAGRISKGYIETGTIPLAAVGVTVGLFLLPHLTQKPLIVALFLAYGFFTGMLIVPLSALIQFNAKSTQLGKVLAGNNFIQNLFMIGFLCLTTLGSLLGANSIINLHVLAVLMLFGTIFSVYRLPQSMMRYMLYLLMTTVYRVRTYNLNNLPSTGGVLLLGNHTSFIDWAIIQIASPRPVHFVMERSIYNKWYIRWIVSRLNMIPISAGGSRASLERISDMLAAGEVVALFPEGRLSRNGQLGDFMSGFERAVKDLDVPIVPFYLHGLWGTATSYAPKWYRKIQKSKQHTVSIHFGKALPSSAGADMVKQAVTTLSVCAWQESMSVRGSIAMEYIRCAKQVASALAVADSLGTRQSHAKLLASALYLAHKLKPIVRSQQNIGLILPTSVGGILGNLAVFLLGKTVVNLNYTSAQAALQSAVGQADIQTIVTSKKFVTKLKAKGFDLSALGESVRWCYIEDLMESPAVGIAGYLALVRLLPTALLQLLFAKRCDIDAPAAILFSSGSEGAPKGVMLSHRNLLSNIEQVHSVFNMQEDDKMLASLPLFHAFGLTVTVLMPLIEGLPAICHPDPTDGRAIGRLVFEYKVTVMCGTSTFLGLYNRHRKLLPDMFQSLRFVVAGAEKLSTNVREAFKQKFGLDVYEGYGTTELSPVASANLPDKLNAKDWHLHKGAEIGTVGLPLPGTAFKVVDPATLASMPTGEAGLILVAGPQLMLGYLNNPEKTNDVLCTIDGITWYKTGDKGYLNEQGFLTIVDRYSRFAKIGGEMVSLSVVEEQALAGVSDEHSEVMALAVPDPRKGEKVVLLYTGEIEPADFKKRLIDNQVEPLLLPAEYYHMTELPKLGTGKKDYKSAKAWVLSQQESA